MISQTPKPKKCKECKQVFVPKRNLQSVCGPLCAIAHSNKLKVKKDRKEYREAKEKIKSRGDWLREAQIAINAYRRESTKHLGCISCGTFNGKANGGHYRSVGSSPETRFVEENIWCQCERCNTHLSGNLINYRIALVQRIGLDRVEWLESAHPAKHYSIDDLKLLKSEYKQKLKQLININN